MVQSSRGIYEDANAFVEKLSTITDFALTKASFPIVLMPFPILSYIQYFTTDLGSDAFLLPFPGWYDGTIHLMVSLIYLNLYEIS